MRPGLPSLSSFNFERLRQPMLNALQRITQQGSTSGAASTSQEQPIPTRTPLQDAKMQDVKKRLESKIADGMRVQGDLNILTRTDLDHFVARPARMADGESRTAYWSLVDAVDCAQIAMRELDTVKLSEIAGNPESQNASKALTDAVKAQHSILEAAKALQDINPSPGLTRLMSDCQLRAGELLNFAARMVPAQTEQGWQMVLPEGTALSSEGGTVLEAVRHLGVKMHGTDILLEKLTQRAQPLFDRVSSLENNQVRMGSQAFTEQLVATQRNILSIQAGITQILNPQVGEQPVLKGDEASFNALYSQLNSALHRLDSLKGTPNFKEVAKNYAESIVAHPGLIKLGTSLPLPKSLLERMGRLDRAHAEVSHMVLENAGSKFMAESLSEKILDYKHEARSDLRTCRTVIELSLQDIDDGHVGSKEHYVRQLKKHLPGLDKNEYKEIAESLVKLIPTLIEDVYAADTLEKLKDSLTHCLLNVGDARIQTEIRDLRDIVTRGNTADARRGDLIAKAFGNTFSLTTLAELSARKLPVECADFSLHDSALIGEPRVLGNGACNTVLLCTYKDANGVEKDRVFKGEVGARRGLDKLNLGRLGYTDLTRAVMLNVATTQVADALGCGNVVARASAGMLRGQFGLFMETAPGGTAAAYDYMFDDEEADDVAKTSSGENLNPTQLYNKLHENDLMAKTKANLQRELCKLEWSDALTGQGDRHQSNYLVNINPETGSVQVTGIDNDACFGHHMIGVGQIDVSDDRFERLHDLADHREINEETRLVIDFAQLDDKDKKRVRNVFGFNQMFVPSFIDKSTFDNLMNIQEGEYAGMLMRSLEPKAVSSALLRLRDAKAYALELQDAGRVVTDWENDTVPTMLDNPNSPRIPVTEFLEGQREQAIAMKDTGSLGFYARDFIKFFN